MLLIKPLLAFRPNKMDWIFAIKTFFAGMLALYIAFSLNLAYPIWAIGTVFVIANPYVGMTASKSLYRILGTALGAIVSVLLTPIFMNMPWVLTFLLALWVGVCLYISLLDRRPRSYVFMLAGYTTVIISYNIIYGANTSAIFDLAVGRFLEISVGVICSALVTAIIFPIHIGPAIQHRISQTLQDIQQLFDQILCEPQMLKGYTQVLSQMTRDIGDLQIMAVHLGYEKSTLQGMKQPLQDMLNQLSVLTANLVAMAERVKQLDALDANFHQHLLKVHQHTVDFLNIHADSYTDELNHVSENFELYFQQLSFNITTEQRVILASLKMDIRHFLQNIGEIRIIWQMIQQGKVTLPDQIEMSKTNIKLHFDHGVAVRGGLSAFLVVMISTGFWILSGWNVGFMLAEMAAISACILTFMDNPVPALKMFIRGNIYAGIMVFIYAYGVFPYVTDFFSLALVLAPFIIFCLLLFPHPPLTGIALPLLMGTIMGLNFKNQYELDHIFFFDAAIATVIGPIISVYIIHLVRAMSPEITAKRILSQHYEAIRQSLYLPYGEEFRLHLRGMLDQIGVLNSKAVQSEQLKQTIQLAIVEASAVINLIRIQELRRQVPQDSLILWDLNELQRVLNDYFCVKAQHKSAVELMPHLLNKMVDSQRNAMQLSDVDLGLQIQIALNNIQSSLCHTTISPRFPQHWVG